MLAKRAGQIDSSGIRKVFDLAQKLEKPVNLSIGQPDFDVPVELKEEAKKWIDAGFSKYTVTQGTQELREKAREKGVTSGRGPTGVAAAAIYLAGKITNDKQTQKGIAGRLAGVTEVTIRNRYEEIARELGIEI